MKNIKNLYIMAGIAIVIVPVLICMAVWFVYNNTHKPEYKWNDYIELLNNKEYEKMYDYLDSTAQAKITKEEFVARNKNIYEGIEAKDIKAEITKVNNEGNTATVYYDMDMDTICGDMKFSNAVKLTREIGKGYTVKWSSKLIFPELEENDKVRVSTLKSKRGNIVDRNGVVIATDSYISNVGIVPEKLTEDKEASISQISQILGVSEDYINDELNQQYVKPEMFVPIKDIPYGDARIVELLKVPGVMVKEKDSRVYPLGGETAHLTGYVQAISAEELQNNSDKEYTTNSVIGKSGLEKMYEDTLRGIDGAEIYIQNNEGERKTTVMTKDAKNGQDLVLTIDCELQKLLYDELGNDKGTAVAMNPSTGELLALVSTPSYDPNNFILGLSTDEWDELNNNPNKPLYNRFQGTTVPGSSFKPITAAIAVDTGKEDVNAIKKIDGLRWQKDESWGNYYVTRLSNYPDVNMENALVHSDNIYFAEAALDIGKDVFKEKLTSMGFGEKIPCDFALYNSQISSDGEFNSDIQLADTGYGQGELLVNPIHLTSLYTMFLNKGNVIAPHVQYNKEADSQIWKSNVISEGTSDIILNDLIKIVEDPTGTGHQAYTDGQSIAGKTGTAEIKMSQDDTEGTELGWFVGMTTDKGENNMLVTMMVEDVKNRGGSHYVVPKVKKALDTAE